MIQLKLFRMVSGVRTPYILELDASRTVVDERVDSDALAVMLRDMQQPVVVDPATRKKAEVLAAWFSETGDNPIPGTDSIRAAAQRKIAKAVDTECTQCEINAIKAEYRALLEQAKLLV